MFDIDAGKLLIIGVIALVVLGPKELPRVLRQIGSALGKMRRMAAEFQGQFAEAMRESEMEDLKKNVQNIAESARVDINYNPAEIADREIREALADKPASSPASSPASAATASAQEAASFDVPAPPEIIDAASVFHAEVAPDANPVDKAGSADKPVASPPREA
jgi:sec-independent protein translocase protein TatB